MRIGIVGGGQLAAMLVQACARANAHEGSEHEIYVLDANAQCPAALVGGIHVQGVPATGEGYEQLAAASDVLTIDLENVSVDDLSQLQNSGHSVLPDPVLLSKVTDKLKQKQWLRELGVPTADFVAHDGAQEVTADPFGFPVVQKAARGGYDGRGVAVLRSAEDNDSRLQVPGYLEQFIQRKMEVSVMVAANGSDDIIAYQPVEMVFHEGGNVLDYLVAPARLSAQLLESAQELAVSTITAMNGQGIFGIEMFLTEDDELLINEISPRTHNSGHYTTEACQTSQFTQQLRILTGEKLGDARQLTPAVMFNLLGAEGYEGDTVVEQEASLGDDEEIAVHLYGKKHCFPGRKMGHVTVTSETVDTALEKMNVIREQILVRGAKQLV
ncbi:MAG: 5-(carboxyamino)imidazole ribonucleotide synthase [Pseudomonadales bacterium]|nr:5-(carboxyamino)imidazole ribonucleotide synthase [Pseudomonadales bacterium]